MGLIIRLERLRALSGAFFWSEGEKTEGTEGTERGQPPWKRGLSPLCPLSEPLPTLSYMSLSKSISITSSSFLDCLKLFNL